MDKSMICVQGGPPRIHMNESRVYQFFENLLSNCSRYRRENLPLEILVSTGDGLIGYEVLSGHAVFFIRDNGVGIRPEDQNQIFTLFWHEAGAEEDKGTGVGLAIVKRLSKQREAGSASSPSRPRALFFLPASRGRF